MATEATPCTTCGEYPAAVEGLFGRICHECNGEHDAPSTTAKPIGPQMPHPVEEGGPVILLKKPGDW